MEQNNQNNKDGLPNVSNDANHKSLLVFALIAVAIISTGGIYFYGKANKKENIKVEESYAPEADAPVLSKTVDNNTAQQKPVAALDTRPQMTPEMVQREVMLIQQKQQELQQRLAAPLMIVNTNETSKTITQGAQQPVFSKDTNTQFLNQVSSQKMETVSAENMGALNTVITQGSFIHAILEPATDSSLPGSLRAIVSAPVYAEDGSQILIPIGSKLIGQYKSGLSQGQSRVFIVWTRVITPNGASVQLGSSSVDSLGVAGMGADQIDRHFWERFGTASLLSLIGAGASNVGIEAHDNAAASYQEAVANSFAQSAENALQQDGLIAPTLKTYQGKEIMVFVAKDIHFENVMQNSTRKINIF